MKPLLIFGIFTLAACEDPALGVGARIDSNGVSVDPVVSGRVGDVGVTISP